MNSYIQHHNTTAILILTWLFLTLTGIELRRRRKKQRRWTVVMIGRHSGNITQIPFLTFPTKARAQQWAKSQNQKELYYEVRPVEKSSTQSCSSSSVDYT